jgi:hypothetical protein
MEPAGLRTVGAAAEALEAPATRQLLRLLLF